MTSDVRVVKGQNDEVKLSCPSRDDMATILSSLLEVADQGQELLRDPSVITEVLKGQASCIYI